MNAEFPPVQQSSVKKADCPECFQVCGWCSWYRRHARLHGCGCQPYGRRKVKCDKAEALKGTKCGTCDGGGKVYVEQKIHKHEPKEGKNNERRQQTDN